MDKCIFDKGDECLALSSKSCVHCKFRKTEEEFKQSANNAILVCRKKRLCKDCKYARYPCTLEK